MSKRRSTGTLCRRIENAETNGDRAVAHFELAVFHDNNGREAEAIPHYEAAIRLGLDEKRNAEALSWLASSLHKIGRPQDALGRLEQGRAMARNASLRRFLVGLERRIRKSIPKN